MHYTTSHHIAPPKAYIFTAHHSYSIHLDAQRASVQCNVMQCITLHCNGQVQRLPSDLFVRTVARLHSAHRSRSLTLCYHFYCKRTTYLFFYHTTLRFPNATRFSFLRIVWFRITDKFHWVGVHLKWEKSTTKFWFWPQVSIKIGFRALKCAQQT